MNTQAVTETFAAVRMSDVRKSFGGVHALRGVSLTIQPGTIHALVGENGAGKSTLLKILQGVVTPTEGSIEVFGEHMSSSSPENSRRLGVSPANGSGVGIRRARRHFDAVQLRR